MIDKEFTTGYGDRFEVIHDGGNLFVNAVSCEGNSYCLAYHKSTNEIDQLIDELGDHLEKIVALNAVNVESSDGPSVNDGVNDDGVNDDDDYDDDADDDSSQFRTENDARIQAELRMNRECIHFVSTPFRLDADDCAVVIEMLKEARG